MMANFLVKNKKIKTMTAFRVCLPQGCRATTRRQLSFNHVAPRNPWYSFDQPQKDKRLHQPWNLPVVLNPAPQHW